MQLKIDLDKYNFANSLGKHAKFASAMLVTRLGRDARDLIRDRLPVLFHLESRWTVAGTRSTRATKAKPVSIVSVPKYLDIHITGGRRFGRTTARWPGRSLIATPEKNYKQQAGAYAKYLSAMDADNGRNYVVHGPRGSSVRERGRQGKRGRVLFWLTPMQEFRARFDLAGTVDEAVARNLDRRWLEVTEYVEASIAKRAR